MFSSQYLTQAERVPAVHRVSAAAQHGVLPRRLLKHGSADARMQRCSRFIQADMAVHPDAEHSSLYRCERCKRLPDRGAGLIRGDCSGFKPAAAGFGDLQRAAQVRAQVGPA